MKIRSLFLSLPLLLSPARVQASDHVKNGSSAIWSLRQLPDVNGDPLPQDLLNVLGQNLMDLEHHGVWLPAGTGKKWVPLEKIVSDLTAFRDSESSEADVLAVLKAKDQITEGLLKKLSAQWEDGLKDMMKEHRQQEGQWNPGKAYAVAFLAYFTVELKVANEAARFHASDVARLAVNEAVRRAAWTVARNAGMRAAWHNAWVAAELAVNEAVRFVARNAGMNAAWHDAVDADSVAAWDAFFNDLIKAARFATHAAIWQKLEALGPIFPTEIGHTSYDLAELFTLLWLTENVHAYYKMVFDNTYAAFPEMELAEVKVVIETAINKAEIDCNMFIKALKRNLDALEKCVLAK